MATHEDTIIRVVFSDDKCPGCGAYWGHTNHMLDYPNRPKVSTDGHTWWWKCYNPRCDVDYWNPETGEVDRVP